MNLYKMNQKSLLAIDTSTPACSIALQHEGQIFQQFYEQRSKHTEVILPMINALMTDNAMSIRHLDGIIVSAGPGAFTGLRVGAAVAGGLAVAAECKIGLLSSLALQAASVDMHQKIVMPVFDARMSQCYYGLYSFADDGIERLENDALASPENIKDDILRRAEIIIGSGVCFEENWVGKTTATFIDAVPRAENAFKCLDFISWQSTFEPIDLRYLRNEVTG